MYSYLYCKNCVSKLLGYYMQLSDDLPMLVHCWKEVDASVNSLDATMYTAFFGSCNCGNEIDTGQPITQEQLLHTI